MINYYVDKCIEQIYQKKCVFIYMMIYLISILRFNNEQNKIIPSAGGSAINLIELINNTKKYKRYREVPGEITQKMCIKNTINIPNNYFQEIILVLTIKPYLNISS